MRQIPKTELSPDNGAIIDTKWKLGSLRYHAHAAVPSPKQPDEGNFRLPEVIIYDHIGFKGVVFVQIKATIGHETEHPMDGAGLLTGGFAQAFGGTSGG